MEFNCYLYTVYQNALKAAESMGMTQDEAEDYAVSAVDQEMVEAVPG